MRSETERSRRSSKSGSDPMPRRWVRFALNLIPCTGIAFPVVRGGAAQGLLEVIRQAPRPRFRRGHEDQPLERIEVCVGRTLPQTSSTGQYGHKPGSTQTPCFEIRSKRPLLSAKGWGGEGQAPRPHHKPGGEPFLIFSPSPFPPSPFLPCSPASSAFRLHPSSFHHGGYAPPSPLTAYQPRSSAENGDIQPTITNGLLRFPKK